MKIVGLLFAVLVLGHGTAIAADFSAPLLDLDGQSINDQTVNPAGQLIDRVGPDGQPTSLTLGRVAIVALFGQYPDEQSLGGEEKFARGMLAMKLADARELTLTAEETAMLKKLISKAYGPLVVLRAWQMLDPGAATAAPPPK
jgi:hypothetical protein